ncbi:MAG: hypothetical protein SGPRY_003897 [Prymnesium sp.]
MTMLAPSPTTSAMQPLLQAHVEERHFSDDLYPVENDGEIIAHLTALAAELQERYARKHGHAAASQRFSEPFSVQEVLTQRLDDKVIFYVKIELCGESNDEQCPQTIGLRISISPDGQPMLTDMLSMLEDPLVMQIDLFQQQYYETSLRSSSGSHQDLHQNASEVRAAQTVPQEPTDESRFSDELHPVAIDEEIISRVISVGAEAQERYARVHGDEAAYQRFSQPFSMQEVLGQRLGNDVIFYAKIELSCTTRDEQYPQVLGLRLSVPPDGQVVLTDMISLEEEPLAVQIELFHQFSEESHRESSEGRVARLEHQSQHTQASWGALSVRELHPGEAQAFEAAHHSDESRSKQEAKPAQPEQIDQQSFYTLLSSELQPVPITNEIISLLRDVSWDAQSRYARVHGDDVARLHFAEPFTVLEALAQLTKDSIVCYVKIMLSYTMPNQQYPERVQLGLRLENRHDGRVLLTDMISLPEGSLQAQAELFFAPQEALQSEKPKQVLPSPVPVDAAIHRYCTLVRSLAERQCTILPNGASFVVFNPVEAMEMQQKTATIYYIKVFTGGQAGEASKRVASTDHVAIKLLTSQGGRFVDLVGPVIMIGQTMPIARMVSKFDASVKQQAMAPEPDPLGPLPAAGEYPTPGFPPQANTAKLPLLSGPQPEPSTLNEMQMSELLRNVVSPEYEDLGRELWITHNQLESKQAELLRRVPTARVQLQSSEVHWASNTWNEICRLTRLTRNIKLSRGTQLNNSDWLLPHGLLLVQGGIGTRAAELCDHLASIFSSGFVALIQYLEVIGRPISLMLLSCDVKIAVERNMSNVEGSMMNRQTLQEVAENWLQSELPALDAAARELNIPVFHVNCDSNDAEMQYQAMIAVPFMPRA